MLEQVHKQTTELPSIPDKRYFTIGEASVLCGVKPHVLRYWEQEFRQLSPSKRRGNRRYYQNKDVLLIRQIKNFLYEQGYTIEGARQRLGDEGVVVSINQQHVKDAITASVNDLEELLEVLED